MELLNYFDIITNIILIPKVYVAPLSCVVLTTICDSYLLIPFKDEALEACRSNLPWVERSLNCDSDPGKLLPESKESAREMKGK